MATSTGAAGNLLQILFGLVVVLGLLGGLAWLLKRHGGMRLSASAPMKIVGGLSVGNREKIMVVEVADLWIVVGVAPGRVSTLATLPKGEHPAAALEAATQGSAGAQSARSFASWLKQTLETRHGK